jgi:hypothetical protein
MNARGLAVAVAVSATLGVAATATPAAQAGTSTCGYTQDGWRIEASRSNTSCPFARSTAKAIARAWYGQHFFRVRAYSPVTGINYLMSCERVRYSGWQAIYCGGGNGALVSMYQGE